MKRLVALALLVAVVASGCDAGGPNDTVINKGGTATVKVTCI